MDNTSGRSLWCFLRFLISMQGHGAMARECEEGWSGQLMFSSQDRTARGNCVVCSRRFVGFFYRVTVTDLADAESLTM